jgi:hypothetical protein
MNIFVIGGAAFLIGTLVWYVWYTRHEGPKKTQ